MKQLIEPREARQHIAAHLPKIPAIDCPIDKCAGRVLREDIKADRPFPPFDRSMMDGFALRAAESDSILEITATAPAGTPQISNSDEPNSCVEIMTGAILPKGTNCVVPYEETERIDGDSIRITRQGPINEGDFIHRKGTDFDAGKTLLETGKLLGSSEIAAAATCGYSQIKVSKIPRIAIACSGDELVAVDQSPAPHQIRRSNDYCIETGLARAQVHAATRTHLPDDPATSKEALTKLVSENEFVILSGGISMGKKDFIPSTLDALGLTCHFHGIAQKPGKPMGYWSNESCAVFALPGNPISTLTCLHHYVLPAILSAMGQTEVEAPRTVVLTSTEKVRQDLSVFLPVTIGSNNTASPCPTQNSGDLVRILQSDGYILIPSGEAAAQKDQSYEFHPWH